jgi:tetratricopeptide (TPR) repeat protein
MTTIVDSAHGAKIAAGKYEQAIEKIAVIDNDVDAFFNNTNLCVAYTKTSSLDDALLACDAAVELADGIRFDRRSYLSRSFKEKRRSEYLAMALSNRGVLRAATGDVELARQDFVEALGVRARSSVAKTNLARLDKVEAKKV